MKRETYETLIAEEIERVSRSSRFLLTREFLQHGNISVYRHCLAVADMSCRIAWTLRLDIDYASLIRGALLHDYFLYDWHDRGGGHRLHGFRHPRTALKNASAEFCLTPMETDIILRHMFPLTMVPPAYLESWIVCMADKICALQETLRLKNSELPGCG